jgi:hypothetical protein
MKFKMTMVLAMFALIFAGTLQAQQEGPSFVGNLTLTGHTPSIQSRISELPPATDKEEEMMDGRSAKYNVIPGKGSTGDKLAENPHPLRNMIPGRAPSLVFDAAFSGSQPTDPALAVGPNHVMVVFNTGFRIFDKLGNPLTGQLSPNPTIFPSGGCCDLTVSYDNQADRWVLTFLGGGAQIAVSDGPDPTTAGWFTYVAPGVQDYNKLSVWSDGYYISNQPGPNRVFALDRAAMLAGAPSPSIQGFNLPGFANFGFASPQILNVTDGNMPAAGNAPIVMFQDDAYGGVPVGFDHIKFWNANVDFATPANSTISAPQEIGVTAFTSIFDGGSFSNLSQPNGGGVLDALQGIVMNQAQFRQFPGYNSAVFNFVVDTDPSGGKLAAIRWYEFRQPATGAPWVLEQEGTYNAPDEKHAWNASIMMDGQGNIGMGYTGMSLASGTGTTNASSYYTGRFSTDPLGTMTIVEQVIALGNSSIPGGGRYGDYSKIDIDPNDDATFWFDNEYVSPAGGRANVVGVFKIAPDSADDTGVIDILQPVDGDLSATETIEVIVRNFGSNPQSNVPVTFTIDGGVPVTETITGPIPAASNVNYTFTATADLSIVGATYTIQSCTVLVGDENDTNDCFSKDVTYLEAADVGVASLDSPVSGSGLTATENVTITIENFGADEQTSIPVFYSIDGGTPIQETYTGSIFTGMTDTFTFTATADLSALGDYEFVAGTELAGDIDTTNDDITVTVSNFICQPESGCTEFNDGVISLTLADQDLNTDCSATGYTDNTDIIFNFVLNDNPFDGILQTGFENSNYAIWIDFDDSNSFESSELIVEGVSGPTAESDTAFTVDFSTIGATANGMHLMRVRGGDENFGTGDVTDPCGELQYGRTNDFTANVTGEIDVLGVNDVPFADASFIITTQPNNQFELTFNTTEYTNDLPVHIYNTLGQILAFYTLENTGNGYTKTLDMSYVSSGVYFVKLGNEKMNKVQRIIVK